MAIEEMPRSRRICAPTPTSRHCLLRSASADFVSPSGCHRHAGGTIAQIDQHTAALFLEMVEPACMRAAPVKISLTMLGLCKRVSTFLPSPMPL